MIIGIDPGKITTFAFISNNKNNISWKQAEIGTDSFIDIIKYIKRQSSYSTGGRIFIEYVHSMPTDGRKAAFKFGYSVGSLHSALKMEGLGYNLILPQLWRSYTNTHDKEDSIKYIQTVLPDISLFATERCKKPNHNIADALCIALYGYHITKEKGGDLE